MESLQNTVDGMQESEESGAVKQMKKETEERDKVQTIAKRQLTETVKKRRRTRVTVRASTDAIKQHKKMALMRCSIVVATPRQVQKPKTDLKLSTLRKARSLTDSDRD